MWGGGLLCSRLRPPQGEQILIKNRPLELTKFHFSEIVSVDALALVRYGLRAADDPRILNTVKVIDTLLKKSTSKGPIWHRYNGDGYGEKEDGTPFDGTGVGRGWPLLSGERGHYELAKGDISAAFERLREMAHFAGVGGMIPEQIWDAPDIPAHTLYNGHSAGSAKPLVWAHAEYIALLRSLRDKKVFDCPHQTQNRYLHQKKKARHAIWHFDDQISQIPAGKKLRFHLKAPARIRYSFDGWKSYQDRETEQNGLGIHVAEIEPNAKVNFTFFWLEDQHWEERNYEIDYNS